MCGRIGKLDSQETQDWFERNDPYWRRIKASQERGTTGINIKPTQVVSFVTDAEVLEGRWGLEPAWVKDPKAVKGLLFNARSETASEKPSFRAAMKHARCIVPVSGFYEWKPVPGQKKKQPFWIAKPNNEPLLLAGLYAQHPWGNSFTILTTQPNELMAQVHDRMPVIVGPDHMPRWLDADLSDPTAVEDLLAPCPPDWLTITPLNQPIEVWLPDAA